MIALQHFFPILIAYLLGSIPTAYLLSKRKGVDIFATGTGNPGAGNIFREIGRKTGFLVFIVDSAKGYLSVLLAVLVFLMDGYWIILVAILSITGHLYSVFTKFKGGGGLATLIGVSLYLVPNAIFIGAIPSIILLILLSDAVWASIIGFVIAAIADLVIFQYPQVRIVSILSIGVILLIRMLMMEYYRTKRGKTIHEPV